ncbi:MAG: histidine triad nucleotide-binding protein [Pseudomonadota bacterium]|jgi:histidine triad (HIT) family protein|nr:histidine triad nucleotide-binding protein [SAR86 cluster bacterium]MEC7269224.1 histidine triad nucleotide-binding protein [Pseudomonadota bacterium]MEC7465481.1 histidine triad nucleotide-binding protein [Pseudomonadota bacterium]MEC7787718.1 histidine triad nucleotide-binding protein [Pseudomonadota bacterium]MEC8108050.1 histidine triad nucleotide-binding protein [Pseudomonadota bacterium]|tara:strand:- start:2136 stop:2489 length:354 start_codon:yes stop_codon:yes gene_type:complete
MDKTIFQKIIDKEIPSEILYEDDLCVVIKDIAPKAPVHLLVIPKKLITKLSESSDEDSQLLGHLMTIVKKMAKEFEIDDAFNVVINNGENAGQTVFHLHIHILGGGKVELSSNLITN